jgi:ComEC/Rec2-related protein
MLSLLVASFIFGNLTEAAHLSDWYTLLFIFIIYLSVLTYTRNYSLKDKIFIKDISLMSFILSFIILLPLSFYFGIYWSRAHIQPVSYLQFTKNQVEVEGIVADREMRSDRQVLSLRLERVEDLTNKKTLNLEGRYLSLPVSMFQEYELYERLRIKAVTEPENWRQVSVAQPLMYRYETDSFLKERSFSVSPYGVKVEELEYMPSTWEQILKTLKGFRLSLIEVLQKYLSEPYASLASGITLGDSSTLSKETQQAMRESGLVHMMVLSGANISFIIGVIWILTRRLSTRLRVGSVLGVSWVFIVMTGMSAPALRAGAMATLAILAESTGRPQAVTRGLLLALGLETLLDPHALTGSASLHLSFLACFGIFIVGPVLADFFTNKFVFHSKTLKNIFSAILGVWLSTSVYILGMSGSVNIFGGVLTLIAEPVVALATVLTLITLAIHFVLPILAQFLSFFNTFLLSIFLFLGEFGAKHLPQITVTLSRYQIIFYYFTFITLFIFLSRKIENTSEAKFLQESLSLQK